MAVESDSFSSGVVFLFHPGMKDEDVRGNGSCFRVRLSKIQLHPSYPRRGPLPLALLNYFSEQMFHPLDMPDLPVKTGAGLAKQPSH